MFVVSGFCNICDRESTFASKYEWLRDHFKCEQQ
jgi:hypothetical protein